MTAFAQALLDPALPVPDGLIDPAGRPAGKRFDVYRNNVVASLCAALADGFPAVRALVGDAFFKAMAGVFVRAHPPRDPRMMHYGQDLPGFLEGFGPVAHLPYLADVARLELALRASYHAADAPALTAEGLARLPQDRLADLRLRLSPAARLLRSPHPVLSIWRKATQADAPAPQAGPEDVIIARPGFDPVPLALPPGGYAFFDATRPGARLEDALAAAAASHPDADPAALLGLALSYALFDPLEAP